MQLQFVRTAIPAGAIVKFNKMIHTCVGIFWKEYVRTPWTLEQNPWCYMTLVCAFRSAPLSRVIAVKILPKSKTSHCKASRTMIFLLEIKNYCIKMSWIPCWICLFRFVIREYSGSWVEDAQKWKGHFALVTCTWHCLREGQVWAQCMVYVEIYSDLSLWASLKKWKASKLKNLFFKSCHIWSTK
jgi:hypothetical protein